MALDKIDIEILKILQKDAKIAANEISKIISIPVNTIYSRIKKMEESGIIKGYKPILDPKKLGITSTAFVFATSDLREIDLINNPDYSMGTELSKFPEVQEVFIVSGEYDYIIKLREMSTEAAGEFVINKLSRVTGITNTRTCMVFRNVKETMDLPLDKINVSDEA